MFACVPIVILTVFPSSLGYVDFRAFLILRKFFSFQDFSCILTSRLTRSWPSGTGSPSFGGGHTSSRFSSTMKTAPLLLSFTLAVFAFRYTSFTSAMSVLSCASVLSLGSLLGLGAVPAPSGAVILFLG